MEKENEQVWERRINVISYSLKGCLSIGYMSLFSSGYLFYSLLCLVHIRFESKIFLTCRFFSLETQPTEG